MFANAFNIEFQERLHVVARRFQCVKKHWTCSGLKLSPPVVDGDDAPNLLGKADEHGVSKIEVLPGKVAPSSKRAVGAEIGGGHCDGLSPAQTILGATGVACEFITSSAAEATVEQSGTQSRCVGSIASAIQISEPASTACRHHRQNRASMSALYLPHHKNLKCGHVKWQNRTSN